MLLRLISKVTIFSAHGISYEILVPAVRKRILSVSKGEEIKNGSIHFAANLFDRVTTRAPKPAGLKLRKSTRN